jgi:hypothetical protein
MAGFCTYHPALGNRVGLHYSRFQPNLENIIMQNHAVSRLQRLENSRFRGRIREVGLTRGVAAINKCTIIVIRQCNTGDVAGAR